MKDLALMHFQLFYAYIALQDSMRDKETLLEQAWTEYCLTRKHIEQDFEGLSQKNGTIAYSKLLEIQERILGK